MALTKLMKKRELDLKVKALQDLARSEESFETREVIRCRDNENIPNTRQHQSTDGIVHHRLIIYRKQLLAHTLCNWEKTGSRSTS